jgi:DNA-directed RNA polymerase subunit RPC12/RpoP
MSRLFEDAETNKKGGRKWQCFVCGKNYPDYAEYKEHILEEHEEGREYLKCPDCGAPVRDMKNHYKAKHPKRIMPKGLQTRVSIWHDFKPGGKKKTTRKPKFRSGEFESKKSGCLLHYRSGMEEEFYNLLEQDEDVVTFYAEPFKVPYYYKGKWHNYIPDIRVNFMDNSTEIWEVKPANQTDYDQNRCKWAAMNDHATNMGWGFVVQTEVALGKLKNKVTRQRK